LDAGRGLNLSQFITKYAPPGENNTGNYLSYLQTQLGVSGDTPLTDLGSPGVNPPRALSPGWAGEPIAQASWLRASAEGAD